MSLGFKLLSKTHVKTGFQCSKALHLELTKDGAKQPLDGATRVRLEEAKLVGQRARLYFPEGVLIDIPSFQIQEAINATARATAGGASAIFEAAFVSEGLLARADILSRDARSGQWGLIEVKAAKQLKDEHIEDVAIQAYIIERAGFPLASVSLAYLNPECRHPNLESLFLIQDVTTAVRDLLPSVEVRVKDIIPTAYGTGALATSIGPHCDKPNACDFKEYCWSGLPKPTIFDLPGIGPAKGWKLASQGALRIQDLNENDFKGKTQVAIRVHKTGERWIKPESIKVAASSWTWPLYFLDFETLAPAIPRYDGCAPYDDIPFQFSCHVLTSLDAPVEHAEYLHLTTTDPRRPLAEALLASIGPKGSVVAYNMGVEAGVLKKLAVKNPDLAPQLLSIVGRLVDPLPVFRENIYDLKFNGGFSIKEVAPAILGEHLDYSRLDISDGMEARLEAEALMSSGVKTDQDLLKKQALLTYCKQDTLAMVELFRWMVGLK